MEGLFLIAVLIYEFVIVPIVAIFLPIAIVIVLACAIKGTLQKKGIKLTIFQRIKTKLFFKEKASYIDVVISWVAVLISLLGAYYSYQHFPQKFYACICVIFFLVLTVVTLLIWKQKKIFSNSKYWPLSLMSALVATVSLIAFISPLLYTAFKLSIGFIAGAIGVFPIISVLLFLITLIFVLYTLGMLIIPLWKLQDKFRLDLICFSLSFLLFYCFVQEKTDNWISFVQKGTYGWIKASVYMYIIAAYVNSCFNKMFKKKIKPALASFSVQNAQVLPTFLPKGQIFVSSEAKNKITNVTPTAPAPIDVDIPKKRKDTILDSAILAVFGVCSLGISIACFAFLFKESPAPNNVLVDTKLIAFEKVLEPFFILGAIIFFVSGIAAFVVSGYMLNKRKQIQKQNDIKEINTPPSSPLLSSRIPEPVEYSSTITTLLGAIITNDLALVQTALTDHPEQLNTAYAQNGNTPLHVAALNGYTDIVRLLLKQPGIDTTRTNNEGKTALDLAREKGFEEIALLLENNHIK